MAYVVREHGPFEPSVLVGPFKTKREAERWADRYSLEADVIKLAKPRSHRTPEAEQLRKALDAWELHEGEPGFAEQWINQRGKS